MEKRKAKTAAPRSTTSGEKTPKSTTEVTSPLELDRFVPWKFMKLQLGRTVVVNKIYQGDHVCIDAYVIMYFSKGLANESCARWIEVITRNPQRRHTTNSGRTSQVSVTSHQTDSYATLRIPFAPSTAPIATTENDIPLTIYYNRAGHVVEIAIKDCPFPINSKLIEVISLCLPFHTLLNKFTCKGKGLDYGVIDQIVKILPTSNLTDICLDNTFVPQGNYYILLDQAILKCLSLSKCKINDVVCREIAKRLEYGGPASKNLRVLSLSCNLITDIGAWALGKALRTNRYIIHLNLCGNRITSIGAGHLLGPLSEFRLTRDEIREKIRIRREYLKVNAAVSPIQKSPISTTTDLDSLNGTNEKLTNLKIVPSPIVSKTNVKYCGLDENLVEDDVFGPSNTVYSNGCWYAVGNLILSSLNLAYNALDYTSLLKIVDVLSYQKDQDLDSRRTGLLRIVIEGNNLPVDCVEYGKIETYLIMLNNEARSSRKQIKSMELQKLRRKNTNSFSSSSAVDALSSGKTKNHVKS